MSSLTEIEDMYKRLYLKYVDSLTKYEESRTNFFGKKPSENLLKAFCKFKGIPFPLPTEEEFIKIYVEKYLKSINR